jgi:hypothetical protein
MGPIRNVCTQDVEHANGTQMSRRDWDSSYYKSAGERACEQWRIEGLRYAEDKLKELARAAHAKRTPASNPLGDQILEAVEELPNYGKFEKLPADTQAALRKFIEQTEISYAANRALEEFDRQVKLGNIASPDRGTDK